MSYMMHVIFSQTQGQTNPLVGFLPFIIIIVVFYLLLILPQQRRQKKHREMIASLRPGDKVITSSGIHGEIRKVKDNTFILKIADKVEIEINKEAIVYKK